MTQEVTFESVLAETEQAKRKSDLQNLAHAHVQLTQAITEGEALKKEIEEAAANPATPPATIKKLYEKAHSFGFSGRY